MDWNEKVSRKELALIAVGLLLLAWLADAASLAKLRDFVKERVSSLLGSSAKEV